MKWFILSLLVGYSSAKCAQFKFHGECTSIADVEMFLPHVDDQSKHLEDPEDPHPYKSHYTVTKRCSDICSIVHWSHERVPYTGFSVQTSTAHYNGTGYGRCFCKTGVGEGCTINTSPWLYDWDWYDFVDCSDCSDDTACMVDSSGEKPYDLFKDVKFYILGVWCVLAVVILFFAMLKKANKSVAEFGRSDPEPESRPQYW